jgi:hypothetical protein
MEEYFDNFQAEKVLAPVNLPAKPVPHLGRRATVHAACIMRQDQTGK